jgi:hypothetical protein
MTIDYQKKDETMDMECDTCGTNEVFDGDFDECIAEAKDEGWIVRKDGDEWVHYCDVGCRLEAMLGS